MNELHLQFLSSPDWARMLEERLVPWLAAFAELDGEVLEVGPGPGLTTDLLRRRAERVTAVEVDPSLAAALTERLGGTNVEVLCADATATGLPGDSFAAATSFTMLHHVPSPEEQDRLFAEVGRLLRPGGLFVGMDSVDSEGLRLAHADDVFVPVDPDTLPARLLAAGFGDVDVELYDLGMRFTARAVAEMRGAPR